MMPKVQHKKCQKIIQILCALIIYLIGFWGTFSQYILLWSDAFFSRDSFVSALALNPVLYFMIPLPFKSLTMI